MSILLLLQLYSDYRTWFFNFISLSTFNYRPIISFNLSNTTAILVFSILAPVAYANSCKIVVAYVNLVPWYDIARYCDHVNMIKCITPKLILSACWEMVATVPSSYSTLETICGVTNVPPLARVANARVAAIGVRAIPCPNEALRCVYLNNS